MSGVWHWFLEVTGSNNTSGTWYGFWSGFGSDLGEFAILGGLISIYRQHVCHVNGCWRLGRHKVDGTPYTTCHRHHPELKGLKPSAADVEAHFNRAHGIATPVAQPAADASGPPEIGI